MGSSELKIFFTLKVCEQNYVNKSMEQNIILFAIFRDVPGGTDTRKIVENQSHLAKFGCGNGAILVIFSDFGLGQPKRHFFDTFF